ncbi:MAG: DUF2059 domain-containing protein [Limnothrix sp.]
MLKSFFSTAAIALALSLSPTILFAQVEPAPQSSTLSAEKSALIAELRTLTNSDQNATQVLNLMMTQMQEQGRVMSESLFGKGTDPELSEVFDETFTRITDRMYTLMEEQIDFVALQQEIDMKLYDEYFSEAELQDLIDFYKTPTGQKTAEIFPQLTKRSVELFSEQVTPAMVEIQQQVLMEEFAFGLDALEGETEMWEEEAAPEATEANMNTSTDTSGTR